MARIRWLALIALPVMLSLLSLLPPGSELPAAAQDPPMPPRLRGHLVAKPLSALSRRPSAQSLNVNLLGQIGGQALAVAVQGSTAYVGIGPRLTIVDVTVPAAPVPLGTTAPLPGIVTGVAISSTYAYLSDDDQGLKIIDVSNPAAPIQVGSYQTPGYAEGVAVEGNLAYVADFHKGLRIVDVSNPAAPTEVGFYQTPGFAMAVTVAGNYAYVAAYNNGVSLRVINVSNPAVPTAVGSYTRMFDPGAVPQAVQVVGNYAFIAGGTSGLRVVNVANPALPTEIGSYDSPGDTQGVAVAGSYAYLADGKGGLRIVSLANPLFPTLTSALSMPGAAMGIAVAGNFAYVADGDSGMRIVDVSTPASPVETGSFAPPGSALGVAVAGSYAYVAGGDSGLRIIDVSVPSSPTQTGALDTPGYANAVAVSGNFAYVADKRTWTGSAWASAGLRIVDVSTPAAPVERSFFPLLVDITGVAVSGNYAYVADGYSGLRILDVSNPASPNEVSFYGPPQPALGVAVAPGVAVGSNYAYVADGYGGLRIVDVTNPLVPSVQGAFVTPGAAVEGVTASGRYAYVADYPRGLRVIDVFTPTNPTEVGHFDLPGGAAAVALDSHYVYVADNLRGLSIIDVANPANMTQVGSFVLPLDAAAVAAVNANAYVADAGAGLYVLACMNCGVVRADFSATPTEGPAPLTATFTNNSTGPYTGSAWDFGDATNSAAQNPPPHVYGPGVYTVTLTVTGPGPSSDTLVRPAYITAYTPVVADFTAAPITGTLPLTVTFTNTSSGSFTSSEWDFGDETSSGDKSPTHTYTTAGVYTVTLSIKGPGGIGTITKAELITVLEAPPSADFGTCQGETSGPAPFTACFLNKSSGKFNGSEWNFGDGTTLTTPNPGHAIHVYQVPGFFTVTLTVNGPGGSSTLSRASYITVPDVRANFSATPITGTVPLSVTFTNNSTGNYSTSQWNFGDGSPLSAQQNPTHTYTLAGSYTVTLTVTGPGGADTIVQANYITASAPQQLAFRYVGSSPNPFNPGQGSTTLSFDLTALCGNTAAIIMDMQGGAFLKWWLLGAQSAGPHSVPWDGKNASGTALGEGTYFLVAACLDQSNQVLALGYDLVNISPAITNMAVSPEPYYTQSGNATLSFNLSLGSNAYSKAVIVHPQLGTIKEFPVRQGNGGALTETWDGRDTGGNLVPDGRYIYLQLAAPSDLSVVHVGEVLFDVGAPQPYSATQGTSPLVEAQRLTSQSQKALKQGILP